ncbi:hypothetical protein BKA70DRAFT_1440852 [Coprinopsis sp. MPI-PUGE-AT-0042]|nr:hypothetical protein BKA70DRAFT_1440852 [Coprinopsis sp. MPI-PUGE-AT-0042]
MPSATLHESAQFEPDDGWKLLLKVQIEANMKDMVDRVRANYNKQVEEDPSNDGQWSKDCQAALKDLSRLAKKQFKTGVDRERNQRRWAAGIGVEERVLREQNEASFKQTESKWGHEVSSTHASDTPGPLAQDLPSELPIITSEAPSPPPMTVFRPSPPPLAPTEPERPFRLTTSIPTNKKPALKKGPVELSTSARSRDNYSGTIRRTKLAVEEVEGNKLPPRSPRAVIGRSASTVRLPGTITQGLP